MTPQDRRRFVPHRFLSDRDVWRIYSKARLHSCQPEHCCDLSFGPRGDHTCWDGTFTFEACCGDQLEPKDRAAFVDKFVNAATYRSTIQMDALLPSDLPLCDPSHFDDMSLPVMAPEKGPASIPLLLTDISVVVLTSLAALSFGGRAHRIARTWASRFPWGSISFVSEDRSGHVHAPNGSAALHMASVARLDVGVVGAFAAIEAQLFFARCPEYWELDCNGYFTHIYTGALGLEGAIQRRPGARWYAIVDDDCYFHEPGLRRFLGRFDPAVPLCVGHLQRYQPYLPPMLAGYGYGIVCTNAAARRLYGYLERSCVREALRRWVLFYGDRAIMLCLRDLGIESKFLRGFSGGSRRSAWAAMARQGTAVQKPPAAFHPVRTDADFDLLERALVNRSWRG